MKYLNNWDSLMFHAQGLSTEDLFRVIKSYKKNRQMNIYLHVVYPTRCSQCVDHHQIDSDMELLHHMRFHGIRNLIQHWDKKEIEK